MAMFIRKLFSLFVCALWVAGCDDKADSIITKPGPATTQGSSMAARIEESDPGKKLMRAIIYSDVVLAEQLLKDHPQIVSQRVNRTYPIIAAVQTGNVDVVKALVNAGADLKVKDNEKWSLMWLAVVGNNPPLIEYLISKGVDVKARESDGETLLFAAPNAQIAELLIKAGVDPKAKDNFNDTALHQAARYVRKDICELLIKAGVDVNARGKWNMAPLHASVCTLMGAPGEHDPIVNLLIQNGADVNAKGFEGQTPLHEAALVNRYDLAQILLNRGAEVEAKDDKGHTPMETAQAAGKINRVRLMDLLIKHGAARPVEPKPR